MGKENGDATAVTDAGGDGQTESDDLGLLEALEAEDAAGRPAKETNDLSQESGSGSPDGEGATETGDEASGDEEQDGESAATSEDDAESEDEGDEEGEEEPKSRVEKRIARLVAERNEVRKERDDLKAEVERYRSGSPQPAGPWDPMAADPEYSQARETETKAQAEYKGARNLLRVLSREPEKALEVVAKAFKVENPTEDQARDLLEDYAETQQERLTDAKSKRVAKETTIRQEYEQAGRVWNTEADADMPWLANTKDPRHKHMESIRKAHPWVAKIPAGRWLIAVAAHKLHTLELRQKNAGKAKPAAASAERRIVPGSGRSTGNTARPSNPQARNIQAAAKRHQETPDDDSLSEYLNAVAG